MGTQAVTSTTQTVKLGGALHGGQSPIGGSLVTFYLTAAPSAATGYGLGATAVGTATSASDGSWSMAPTYTCTAGQQAYFTASGGYQGSQTATVNSNLLMMAAVGDCSTVTSTTYVSINEVTTVAAAYALSGFTATSLSNGLYYANVGAPVANSTAVGGITAAAPAGLAHAFLNAATLANYATGAANGNVTVGLVTAHVPTAEIYTLANIMSACVNTTSAPGALSSQCSSLFGFTPSIAGVTPANTLQAFINLARNPYPSSAALNGSTGLISLSPATAAFSPYLSGTPLDWSMAVDWNGGPATSTSYYLAMDANDTVYADYATTSTTTAALYAVNAYGVTVPAFSAPSLTAAGTGRGIAVDTAGNLYVAYNTAVVDHFNASSGSLLNTYTSTVSVAWPLAVDKLNNLWVGHVSTSSTAFNLEELTLNAGALSQVYYNHSTYAPYGIAIDAFQDVWPTAYYSSGTLAQVLANTNTAASPAYAASNVSGTGIVSATLASSATKPYNTVFDTSGNAYQTITGGNAVATTGFEEIIPGASGASTPSFPLAALNPQAAVFGTTAGSTAQGNTLGTTAAVYPAIDGAGVVFIPDNNSSSQGIHAYVTQSPSGLPSKILSQTAGFKGCNLQSNSATCGTTTTAAIYSPRAVVIDSTGAVWSNVTGSGLVEVIGLAMPSYPQLSLGNWSLAPGNTAVAALP